jgi:hypothetical protein
MFASSKLHICPHIITIKSYRHDWNREAKNSHFQCGPMVSYLHALPDSHLSYHFADVLFSASRSATHASTSKPQKLNRLTEKSSMLNSWVYETDNGKITVNEMLVKNTWECRPAQKLWEVDIMYTV